MVLGVPLLSLPPLFPPLFAVLLGARGASRPVWDRGFHAVPAQSLRLGLPAFFLCVQPGAFPGCQDGFARLVVADSFLSLGFWLGWGGFRASLRLLCLWRGLSWQGAGGVFPWRLSSRFRPGGRAAARIPRLRQCEGELESSSFHPRGRGNPHTDESNRANAGSIPAWAGGTLIPPHVSRMNRGLSPRGRGNLAIGGVALLYQRSIPAWVGEPPRPG